MVQEGRQCRSRVEGVKGETANRANVEAKCFANGERCNTQETQLNEHETEAPSVNQRGGTMKDEKPLTGRRRPDPPRELRRLLKSCQEVRNKDTNGEKKQIK